MSDILQKLRNRGLFIREFKLSSDAFRSYHTDIKGNSSVLGFRNDLESINYTSVRKQRLITCVQCSPFRGFFLKVKSPTRFLC